MGPGIVNYWDEKFTSAADSEERDKAMIRKFFPSCVGVEKTGSGIDRQGVDYICVLRGGAVIGIDAKTRERGCSKYWKHGQPELAVESRSVVESNVLGWTLSTNTQCDYILYTFHPDDYAGYFVIPFQALRKAFIAHGAKWKDDYGVKYQHNKGLGTEWTSACVFVPADVLIAAISSQMAALPEPRQTQGRMSA